MPIDDFRKNIFQKRFKLHLIVAPLMTTAQIKSALIWPLIEKKCRKIQQIIHRQETNKKNRKIRYSIKPIMKKLISIHENLKQVELKIINQKTPDKLISLFYGWKKNRNRKISGVLKLLLL